MNYGTQEDVYSLINNVDSQSLSLVIGESIAVTFLSYNDCDLCW